MKQVNSFKLKAQRRQIPRLVGLALSFFGLSLMLHESAAAQALQAEWGVTTNWKARAGRTSAAALDNTCRGVAYDQDNNVYIAGTFVDTMDFDPGAGEALLVATDLHGNLITQGNFYIAKYDASGNYVWAKNIKGTNNRFVQGDLIRIDANGDIVVAGAFRDSADFDPGPNASILAPKGLTTFIAKYDTAGNYIWAKSMASDSGSSSAYGIATDRYNNIYVSGRIQGTVYFDPGTPNSVQVSANNADNYVVKFDSDGNYIWGHRMGSSSAANSQEEGIGLTVDGHGNVISTGFYGDSITFSSGSTVVLGQPGVPTSCVVKHDSTGNLTWAFNIPSFGGYTGGQNVAVDEAGNIYAVGAMIGKSDFDPGADTAYLYPKAVSDGYLAKYDANGNYLWAFNLGGNLADGSVINVVKSVRTDHIGNVYITGEFSGLVDFDPGPDTAALTAGAGAYANGFVAKYDAEGNYIWAGLFESASSQGSLGTALDVTPSGTVYAAGYFQTMVDLDPGTATDQHNSLSYAIYLAKLVCGDTTSTYLEVVECDSSYTLNGEVYAASGVYTQHFAGATYCDSAVILDLTIEPLNAPVISIDGFILRTTLTYDTYQWIKDGVELPGETNSTLLVSENGDYQVRVTNEQSCTATSAVYPVNNASVTEGWDPAEQISVYPNPAMDWVRINSPVDVNVTITSPDGRQVRYVENVRSLNIGDLSAGVYFLKLSDVSGRTFKIERLVKQK